jgi:predicted metal-dependent HD superfamily phosphohydrolase
MPTEHQLARAGARWKALWTHLAASIPSADNFREIVAAHSEAHRHYHTLEHVLDCLHVFDQFEHLAARPAEIEVALWFHDAVYDTQRKDNEEASARWAVRILKSVGVEKDAVDRIRRMILATRHEEPPGTPDEALALDIDLSILGREPDEFAAYQEQVRREYAWVPDNAYHRARAGILNRFLERESIFRRPEVRAKYERAARSNIESSLELETR